MNLDELKTAVVIAIHEIEEAERKVSRLEEEIAKHTLPSSVEGRVARRGAVRAAAAGREEKRAVDLTRRFLAEACADKTEFGVELVQLLWSYGIRY